MAKSKCVSLICPAVLSLTIAAHAEPQASRPVWPLSIDPASATTASADEESLLMLQLTGRAPLIHTSIRSFSARALDTLASFERPQPAGGFWTDRRFSWMRPSVSAWFNSGLPSETDGVVWAGRGLTGAISMGGLARLGPISIAARPVGFLSENRPFTPPIGANPYAAPAPYQGLIDLPYRFGNRTYGRLDPGESWLQADTRYVVAGVSTATQSWGPMHVFPLLLGPNAGGFPHVLLGTGLPWDVGIGHVSGRMAVGRLDPSAFAPSHAGDPRRLASELVGVFSPRGVDGLEIGGGRFFHRRWPADGVTLGDLGIPLEGFLKNRLSAKDAATAVGDNQLASAFFRLAVPKGGVEIYGEFLRDDHSYDFNDAIGEPDHESAYALGLRHVWGGRSSTEALSMLTFEVVNGRITQLDRLRPETAMYVHDVIVEGHTERGKLLGAPAAFGGSGYAVIWGRTRSDGGWSATVRSEGIAHDQEGGNWNGSHVGFDWVEVTRCSQTRIAEWTLGVNARLGWRKSAGGASVGLVAGFRPGRTR